MFQRHVPTSFEYALIFSFPSIHLALLTHFSHQSTSYPSEVSVNLDASLLSSLSFFFLLALTSIPPPLPPLCVDGRQILKYSFDDFVYERAVVDVPFRWVLPSISTSKHPTDMPPPPNTYTATNLSSALDTPHIQHNRLHFSKVCSAPSKPQGVMLVKLNNRK
jgi:hypothetical protein